MDRLKYRIWDNQENKYYEPTHEARDGNLEELLLSPKGELMMRTLGGAIHESCFRDRFTVEMCTGLKDKSGTFLFDGDLCFDDYFEEDGVVKFDDAQYVFEHENIINELCECNRNLEIYGTIHDKEACDNG